MPEGWATTDLVAGLRDRSSAANGRTLTTLAGLRDRSSAANGTRRATRCRTSLSDPLLVGWPGPRATNDCPT